MKSLYSKFAFITINIMIFSGIFSFILSNAYYQLKLKQHNDAKITRFANEMADFVGLHPLISLEDYFEHIGAIGYQIFLVDEDGKEQYFGSPFRKKNLPEGISDKVVTGTVYHGIRTFPHKTFVTGFFANELKNSVGVPFRYQQKSYALFIRPDIKLMFNEMHILFGWLLVISILMSILLVLLSTKYLVHPIRKLSKATKEISEGNYSIELDITRRDELGELAKNFTTMSRKLEKVNTLRKELISNLSHDIQSPLTNIKGYLNLLENAEELEKQKYFTVVYSEVDRLSNMTKQLLLLSSIESKRDLMEVTRVDIVEQLKSLLHQYHWKMIEKGIMVSYTLPGEVVLDGDSSLLYSVWENLLTNAIKYNHENGSIDIEVSVGHDWIEVMFKDTGIGLREAELERIFDRFYRADTSRTRSVEGTGLGLSIVKSIVELHNGKLNIVSQREQGTIITVILPKSRQLL